MVNPLSGEYKITGKGMLICFSPMVAKWNSWASIICSIISLAGSNELASCFSAPPAGASLANEFAEKSNKNMLKTATSNVFMLFEAIPISKFAAKIRVDGGNLLQNSFLFLKLHFV